MVGKRGPKGVRNKFRQILLIEGHPDFLYKSDKRSVFIIKIGVKSYNLGTIHTDLHEHLRKIPDSVVEIRENNHMSTKEIPVLKGLHIRKAGSNTTIEVSAPTEKLLFDKIEFLRDFLEKKGVPITERCSWVCTIDKGKQESTSNEESYLKTDVKSCDDFRDDINLKDIKPDAKKKKPVKKKGVKSKDKVTGNVKKSRELREMVIKMGIGNESDSPDFSKARQIEKEVNKSKKQRRSGLS